MTRADVAVAGGGIAGAVAAARLAAAGVDAVWLAPPGPPGVGEHLSPAALPPLRRVGLAEALEAGASRPAETVLSAWGRPALVPRSGIVHLEGAPRVLDRARFEEALAARAAVPRRLEAVRSATGSGTTGWRLALEGGDTVAARFVIDATGRRAAIGRTMGRSFAADRLVALYARAVQGESDVAPTPATVIEAVPDGWCYAALLPEGDALAVYGFTDADLLPRGVAPDDALRGLLRGTNIARWIDEADFRLGPAATVPATTRWIAPCAGPGWAAAGDAAAAFDPLSSHGMTAAIWSGAAAADAACAFLAGDDRTAAYAATVAGAVDAFLADRRRIYAAEPRFADRAFWRRRHAPASAERA